MGKNLLCASPCKFCHRLRPSSFIGPKVCTDTEQSPVPLSLVLFFRGMVLAVILLTGKNVCDLAAGPFLCGCFIPSQAWLWSLPHQTPGSSVDCNGDTGSSSFFMDCLDLLCSKDSKAHLRPLSLAHVFVYCRAASLHLPPHLQQRSRRFPGCCTAPNSCGRLL